MRISVITIAALTTLFAAGGTAVADPWQSAAVACTVDADSIQTARQANPASHISFAAGKTGTIKLFCPVPHDAYGNAIAITYRDSTGTDTGAHVMAELRRINKDTSSISTVSGAFVDSDDFVSTSAVRRFDGFSHAFDQDGYYYFVMITLTRTTTAQEVSVGGVELFSVIP
jgi:hypothetical protein